VGILVLKIQLLEQQTLVAAVVVQNDTVPQLAALAVQALSFCVIRKAQP
jgi:hypothetical protein